MLAHGVQAIREHLAGLPPSDGLSFEEQRKFYDAAERIFALPAGIVVSEIICGGRPCELLKTEGRAKRALLYLHGGGYVIGSTRSHRHLISTITLAAESVALVPNYRLAPEHPFPAALTDAVAAYRGLQDQGWRPEQITIIGDSAGGGLAIATLLYLKGQGMDLPGAVVCISPWTDMTASGASYKTKAEIDPMVRVKDLEKYSSVYRGDVALCDPMVSPLFGDLAGLPPLLIQVGSDEILYDDASALHNHAKVAGCDSTLEVWDGMFHVWHWFGEYLDEASAASESIANFMRRYCPA